MASGAIYLVPTTLGGGDPQILLPATVLEQVRLLNGTVRELQAQLQALREENASLRQRQAAGDEDLPASKRVCGARASGAAGSDGDMAMLQAVETAASPTLPSGVEPRPRLLQRGSALNQGAGPDRRTPVTNGDDSTY